MNKKKYIIISSCILLVLLLIVISFFLFRFMSKNTKEKLINSFNNDSYYYDYIENDVSDIEKYIMFSLVKDYNENGSKQFTYDELKSLVEKQIDYKLQDDELDKLVLSKTAIEKGLIKDIDKKTFTMNIVNKKKSEIAKIPFVFYFNKKVSKIGFNKYQVVLTKYEIENPYELYNFYEAENEEIRKNKSISSEANMIQVDLGDVSYNSNIVLDYLCGNKEIKEVKEYVKEEHLKKMNVKSSEIKVIYTKKDDVFKIKKIKG